MREVFYQNLEPLRDYWAAGLKKTEVFGLKLLDLIGLKRGVGRKEVEKTKKDYSEFITGTAMVLKGRGIQEPKNSEELQSLLSQISIIVLENFKTKKNPKYSNLDDAKETKVYSEDFFDDARNRRIDCDSSAIIFSDILKFFKIECSIAFFSNLIDVGTDRMYHAMLKIPQKFTYPETFVDTQWHLWDVRDIGDGAIGDRKIAEKSMGK